MLADLLLDLRYAARTLSRQPAFALGVAMTLALGLTLNAVIFGIVDALLLRPFQFQDYERIIVLFETPKGTSNREPVAPATFQDWRRQMRSVDRLVAWEMWAATLGGRTEPEPLQGFRVTPGFFETLGIQPSHGRTFRPSEEQPGEDRRVIIGEGLWKRRFGGDPHAVGSTLLLDAQPYTIVGIAPAGFEFPIGAEVWAPLAFSGERAVDRRNRSLTVLGKLTRGQPLEAARLELEAIAERLSAQYPDTHSGRGATVRPLSTAFTEDTAGSLVGILQVGGGLVLLVACANLAGLLLARANDRQREIAVRTALGASRVRIARQLVTEVVLLAVVASVAALFCARTGLEVLRGSIPADMARHIEGWNNLHLDDRLMLIVPAFAVLIGLAVGLIPALSAWAPVSPALKDGGYGAIGGVKRQRARQMLVAAEIAFSLALLVAAGLSFEAGRRLIEAPGGFDPRSLLTFNIPLPEDRYAGAGIRREFVSRLTARLGDIPGVERAAAANVLPAAGWRPTLPLRVEDVPVHDEATRPTAGYQAVSAGYFETMNIPILRGRSFSTVDREDSQPVAIVSAALADRFWPGGDPLGRRLQLGEPSRDWLTIVGVAGDVTMYNWWDGIDVSAVYVPLRQSPPDALAVVARTRGEPLAVAKAAAGALASIDPLLAADSMRTMDEAIVASSLGLDLVAHLLGICGAIALLLAGVGIYSMMAYAVSQRRHEFGLRMALGASQRDILGLAMRQAGLLTAVGLVIGVALAALFGSFVSSSFMGVVQLDEMTFFALTVVLALVSLVAAYVPAARSMLVDPAAVLRSQ